MFVGVAKPRKHIVYNAALSMNIHFSDSPLDLKFKRTVAPLWQKFPILKTIMKWTNYVNLKHPTNVLE